MSRLRNIPGWAKLALGLLLLGAASTACEEDSKTAPEKCGTPQLVIYDVQGGAQGDADANPCVTNVGHAVSEILPATPSGGNATGGTAASGGSAGKGGGGSAGKGSSAGQGGQGGDAGTGGA
jgi:hypothetical protein